MYYSKGGEKMRVFRNLGSTVIFGICFVVMISGCLHGLAPDDASPYAKPGFYTQVDEGGRLWVFEEGSEALAEFKSKGEPGKIAIRPGAGPGGITIKSVDRETIIAYVVAKPGFYTSLDQHGRLWVFAEDSEELAAFKEKGELARHVIRPAAGPLGLTVKAPTTEVIEAYLAAE
jgi:hypothetical protein